jgi:hypothetical protein
VARIGSGVFAAGAMIVAVACSSTPAAAPEPADKPTPPAPETREDGGADAAADAAAECVVSPAPPNVPNVDVVFRFVRDGGGDAGGADASSGDGGDGGVDYFAELPEATGGDPRGTWIIDRVTFYLPPQAEDLVDLAQTRGTGTGWAVLDGSRYRLSTNFDLTFESKVAGTVSRQTLNRTKGTYAVEGTEIVVTPECVDNTGGATEPRLPFAVRGNRGFLVSKSRGQLGLLTVVLEGTLSP